VGGLAALYVDRGGGSLQVLAPGDDPDVAARAARGLAGLVGDGRMREVVITKVDGEPVSSSPFRERLVEAGFVAGYRGLVLRANRDRADLAGTIRRRTTWTGATPAGGRFPG
jgi:ATP-dependent Lhr-like helicase